MAFPVSDSFTGTDETILSTYNASWVVPSGAAAGMKLTSNRAYSYNNSQACYYNDAPPSADYSVFADIHVISTGVTNSTGVAGRMATNTPTFYLARLQRVNSTTAQWQLYRFNAGVATQLGTNVSQAFAAGNVFRVELRMQGSDISVYVDGVVKIGPVTDSSPITSAGFAGIRSGDVSSSSTGYHIDNWEAAEISGGGGGGLALPPRRAFNPAILNH